MARTEIDLKPLQHITADAIGQPGSRVFYLQGWRGTDPQPVTLILEKIQLTSLVVNLEQMLDELARDKPGLLLPKLEVDPEKMSIHPPVDPLFRVGQFGLGYDEENDNIVILVREVVTEEGDESQASEVRFWCTRPQVSRLIQWSQEVIARGRPLCPQCGQPMEPEGHFCPKKNGHKH